MSCRWQISTRQEGGSAFLVTRERQFKRKMLSFPRRLAGMKKLGTPYNTGMCRVYIHTLRVYLCDIFISTTMLGHLWDVMPGRWHSNLPWREKSQSAHLPRGCQLRTGNCGHLRHRDSIRTLDKADPRAQLSFPLLSLMYEGQVNLW